LKFSDLDLHPEVLNAIEKLGFQEATPIQESAIPIILEGKDVAGLAQTGTGKTAAFVAPLLDRLIRSKTVTPEQAQDEKYQKRIFADWKAQEFILILVPTRELVDQVAQEIEKLRGEVPVKVLTIYGGTGYDKQLEGLKGGVDFIVGTPGRLIDLYKTHAVDFRQVRAIVFDEADRMFDMGFRDDMKFILRRVPNTRQFLVFSATLNFEVLNIAYMHGAEPIECNVSRDQAKAENVKDEIYHCGQTEKSQFLLSHLKKRAPKQVIIFSNFKHNVERIAQFLNENDYPAVAISSLLTQAQRNRVIEQFKAENHLNILVATDVAARGLDIKGVDLVINFELPDDPENYVHRIGRTGRAGEEGHAISLVSDRDVEALQRIEDYLKHKISVGWLEDSDLVTEFKEFPQGESRYRATHLGAPKGPRENRERGRDRRPRDRRDRDHRPQRAEGEHRDHRSQRADGEHRDRAMGRHSRHGGAEGERPMGNGAGRRMDERNQAGQPKFGQKDDRRHGRHDRPGRKDRHNRHDRHQKREFEKRGRKFEHAPRSGPSPQVQEKTIGQKISGFFKGLFGR